MLQSLRDEMNQIEEDLLEAEAKNRLYYLLGERTRREHMTVDQKVMPRLAHMKLLCSKLLSHYIFFPWEEGYL
jgi:hypothetical protein